MLDVFMLLFMPIYLSLSVYVYFCKSRWRDLKTLVQRSTFKFHFPHIYLKVCFGLYTDIDMIVNKIKLRELSSRQTNEGGQRQQMSRLNLL